MLNKLTDFVTGGLFKEIKETAMAYFPPDMSPEKKAEAERALTELGHRREMDAQKLIIEASAALDKRIAEQEGTASDLKSLPVVGRLVLFLRGLQRPTWGFGTLWMDVQWFFSGGIEFTDKQETALILINLLVLGFLFGERAVKNLEPLIMRILDKKA